MRYFVEYGKSLTTKRRGIVAWDSENPEITLRDLGVDPNSEDDVQAGIEKLDYLVEKGYLITSESGNLAEARAAAQADADAREAEAQSDAAKAEAKKAEEAKREARAQAEAAQAEADAAAADVAQAEDAAASKREAANQETEKRATRRSKKGGARKA